MAPSLTGSLATGVCEADVPWIFYDVVLTDPDGQATSRLVTLTLSDGTNSHVIELGELDEDGTLSGQALWPGASVDGEGNPTGWPGWEQTADGTWVETDDNFAWTRNVSSAVLAVNPDLPLTLAYPPATPNCLTGPGGGEGDDGSTPAAAGQGAGLASTGFAGGTIAIVAGIIVLAGAAFLVIAAIRRKKKA
ncbi:cell wall protein [Agromyces sp. CFH 90414]|uniref:Cell wall protein n=1 Tax=Agromyces agglutinans TaxID=2662258 RepID=A0A6I2FFE3_9MICO|nr:cell wall protein [Agromyces agglutinans]